MSGRTLLDWLEPRSSAGRLELAQTVRALILARDSDLLSLVPFEDDEPFLEPALFAFFASGEKAATLRQLMFSYITGAAAVAVKSDEGGSIFIPRLGVLRTEAGAADLLLTRCGKFLRLTREDKPVAFSFEPSQAVGLLEFLTPGPPLFRFLLPSGNRKAAAEMVRGSAFVATGAGAIRAMTSAAPGYAAYLLSHCRMAVACEGAGVNSFAAPAAHGAIFLSTGPDPTVPQLIEEIAHQGGHVAFGAASLEPETLLQVAPASPVAPYSGVTGDRRSVYEALHGVVTEALMVQVLSSCLYLAWWSEEERLELRGRLAYIGSRALTDLKTISHPALLSPTKAELLGLLRQAIYTPLYERRSELERLDLSSQPYAFSLHVFKEANSARSALAHP